MRCSFSKPGEGGGRISCNKPADKVVRSGGHHGIVFLKFPVCLKHYLAWTRHPKNGYGLAVKSGKARTENLTWD